MYYRHEKPFRRRRLGLTLTELLVSTAILAWMIMVANQMLVASRRAIRDSEAAIRSNANARAVATRLRKDIEQVSTDGIMLLTEIRPVAVGQPRRSALSFTSVGSYRSLANYPATGAPVSSNLARIDLGLSLESGAGWKDDRNTPTDATDDIYFGVLYRRAMVSLPGLTGTFSKDYENMCLAYYRIQPMAPAYCFDQWAGNDIQPLWAYSAHPEGPKELPYIANPMWSGPSVVDNITLPVFNLVTLDNLWPYMLGDVSYLNIQWTDGSVDQATGNLRWYGYGKNASGNEVLTARDDWINLSPFSEFVAPVVEFGRSLDVGTKAYCAFWSYRHREAWPKALKVQFKVGNPPRPFELVVAIPSVQ